MAEACFGRIELVALHAGRKLEGGGPSHSNCTDANRPRRRTVRL